MMLSRCFNHLALGSRILWHGSRCHIWEIFYRHNLLPALIAYPLRGLRAKRFAVASEGERLRAFLTKMGGSFIKFGQILSVRPDIIGDKLAQELRLLQDQLPPSAAQLARTLIETRMEKNIDEVFATFHETPHAIASIAQVHYAKLHNGDEVAVKILRANIARIFARDIAFFLMVTRMIERFISKSRIFKLQEIVTTYQSWVAHELNLQREGAACAQMRNNLEHEPQIHIPKIYWEYSGQDILVSSWVSGIKIDEKAQLIKAGHDPKHIITRAVELFFIQVFRDGFFHADIHPGNLFVQTDGSVAAVDFGIVGRLDKQMRFFLADILIGFIHHDYDLVARVHFDMGYVPQNQSREEFALALRSVGEPIFGSEVKSVSFAEILFQMITIARRFDMQPQLSLLLLHKTMLQAEGIGRILVPGMNIWLLAQPLIEEWLLVNRNPLTQLRDLSRELMPHLLRLPEFLARFEQNNMQDKQQENPIDTAPQKQKMRQEKKFPYQALFGFVTGMFGSMLFWLFWMSP